MDVAVVGGGCLGLSAGLALAEDGHEVTVHERATLGAGSTGKAAGIVSTMTWNDDDARLIAATRGRIGELISLAAGELPHARSAWKAFDSITVAAGDKRGALHDIQHRLERMTEEPERLDHRSAAAAFPGLRFTPGEEVLVAQEDGAIEAGDLVAILRWILDAEGVSTVEHAAVPDVDTLGAEAVVVAGGAWTRGLFDAVRVRLPLQAFRVQLASLAWPDTDGLPIVHDTTGGFYARPESAASVLAGDGTVLEDHDPDDYNEAGDAAFVEAIAGKVVQRFEHGAQAKVRSSWAGLCVATPDRRPLCGPVPGRDDLFVLSGDNGFGLMRSLALGERLSAAVDGDVHADTDPRRFPQDPGRDFAMAEGFGF